ncbi:hypothetical protein EVAR_30036_1 [Eumeta japonica]|uniref:Uncharacterized protein n=1 Tax=Eumeta variegata TaxID=151549 RepID=A0A4C1VUK6_EUMVA|nr:hypothetical protein EVAR_30036_1 [Eumeta japonica]
MILVRAVSFPIYCSRFPFRTIFDSDAGTDPEEWGPIIAINSDFPNIYPYYIYLIKILSRLGRPRGSDTPSCERGTARANRRKQKYLQILENMAVAAVAFLDVRYAGGAGQGSRPARVGGQPHRSESK